MVPFYNDLYSFLLIGLSGFIAVKTYRYFKNEPQKELGDFEFFGLSIFWGLILLFVQILSTGNNPEKFMLLFNNPFAAGLVLPVYGVAGGWLLAMITNTKWFKRIIKFLKNPW